MRRSLRTKISQMVLAMAVLVMLMGMPSGPSGQVEPHADCVGSVCDT